MEICLRAALQSDLAAIVALDRASFLQPWSPQSFERALADEKTLVLVAQTDGKIVGFGVAYVVLDEAEIATLAVDEAVRGQRLGEKILVALTEFCRENGARSVFLEVRVSNEAAQKLYARNGFVEAGLRHRYYANGEDAILMKKNLAPSLK